jgi:hypothetical protein
MPFLKAFILKSWPAKTVSSSWVLRVYSIAYLTFVISEASPSPRSSHLKAGASLSALVQGVIVLAAPCVVAGIFSRKQSKTKIDIIRFTEILTFIPLFYNVNVNIYSGYILSDGGVRSIELTGFLILNAEFLEW